MAIGCGVITENTTKMLLYLSHCQLPKFLKLSLCPSSRTVMQQFYCVQLSYSQADQQLHNSHINSDDGGREGIPNTGNSHHTDVANDLRLQYAPDYPGCMRKYLLMQ
jgi:uncharacterized protein (UPF0262 family)